MEFSEIKEIDEIAIYARTFQGRQVFIDAEGTYHYSSQPSFLISKQGNVLDYEKVLKDSPPISPKKLLSKQICHGVENDDEPLDKIINEITMSLSEQAEYVSSPLGKPKSQKIVSWSTDVKEEIEEEDGDGENKGSRRTTDTTIDKKDDDEEDIKVERGPKTFEKANDELISKSYLEATSIKSFINTKILTSIQVRINFFNYK